MPPSSILTKLRLKPSRGHVPGAMLIALDEHADLAPCWRKVERDLRRHAKITAPSTGRDDLPGSIAAVSPANKFAAKSKKVRLRALGPVDAVVLVHLCDACTLAYRVVALISA